MKGHPCRKRVSVSGLNKGGDFFFGPRCSDGQRLSMPFDGFCLHIFVDWIPCSL